MAIQSQDVQIDGQPIAIQGGNSTAVKVDGSAVTQPVSGTVTVTQPTGTNLHAVVDSGTVTANQGTAAALAGAWPVEVTDGTNILGTSTHPLRIDPTGTTTQPVSGTVTTTPVTSSTAVITQVAATTTSSSLLAANASRKKAIIFVGTLSATQTVEIAYGTSSASGTNFTYKVTSNNTTIEVDTWVGAIQVVTSTGTNTVTVTELS